MNKVLSLLLIISLFSQNIHADDIEQNKKNFMEGAKTCLADTVCKNDSACITKATPGLTCIADECITNETDDETKLKKCVETKVSSKSKCGSQLTSEQLQAILKCQGISTSSKILVIFAFALCLFFMI